VSGHLSLSPCREGMLCRVYNPITNCKLQLAPMALRRNDDSRNVYLQIGDRISTLSLDTPNFREIYDKN